MGKAGEGKSETEDLTGGNRYPYILWYSEYETTDRYMIIRPAL